MEKNSEYNESAISNIEKKCYAHIATFGVVMTNEQIRFFQNTIKEHPEVMLCNEYHILIGSSERFDTPISPITEKMISYYLDNFLTKFINAEDKKMEDVQKHIIEINETKSLNNVKKFVQKHGRPQTKIQLSYWDKATQLYPEITNSPLYQELLQGQSTITEISTLDPMGFMQYYIDNFEVEFLNDLEFPEPLVELAQEKFSAQVFDNISEQ
jgi:hypothetical protein